MSLLFEDEEDELLLLVLVLYRASRAFFSASRASVALVASSSPIPSWLSNRVWSEEGASGGGGLVHWLRFGAICSGGGRIMGIGLCTGPGPGSCSFTFVFEVGFRFEFGAGIGEGNTGVPSFERIGRLPTE